MARFVSLPSGTVFAQKPLQFNTPLQGSNLSTKDVVDILNVAEAVGKSESVGALAGKAKENIGGMVEGVKDWWNKDKTGEAGAAGETGQSAEEGIRPPADMERAGRRDTEGGSIFNKSAQSTPLDTSGTGAVQPPPQASPQGQVPDKAAPQQAPVNPQIPAAPPVGGQEVAKAAAAITPILPAVKVPPVSQEPVKEVTVKPQSLNDPKREKLFNKALEGGDAKAAQQLSSEEKEYARYLAKQAQQKVVDQGIAQASEAPAKSAVTVDQAAAARVQAAKPMAEQQVQIKLAPQEPVAAKVEEPKVEPPKVFNLAKEPDKVAQEFTKLVSAGVPQRQIERYIAQYQSQGTTQQDYYNMIGALKAAKNSLPEGSSQRSKLFMEEETLRRKIKAVMEQKGLKYDESKVPEVKVPKTTSEADMLYEQALAKFTDQDVDALTDAEKFALAGGPASAKAPQPSAPARKVVGAQGVEVKQETKPEVLKQKALEPRRPEVSVPPAQGGAAAGGVPTGRSANQAVVLAPSAPITQAQPAPAGIAQPNPAGPAPTNMQQAVTMAAGAAAQKAAEQVARTQAQPAAEFNAQYDQILGQIQAKPTAPAPAGTKAVTERDLLAGGDPETILKMVEERMKKEEEASTIQIPANITYQQLIALARKATTPANQQRVLAAFETARNKPPPKTLVEMYNGDNEIRAMAMLEAAFPAKAQEPDAYTKQLKYAQAYKAVADAIKAKQQAEESQASEALKTQKGFREEYEIASGDVGAQIANKIARARASLAQAAEGEEKARKTAELLNMEKAGMALNADLKIAQIDKLMTEKIKLAGAGGGGKKGVKTSPINEWGIKKDVVTRSIDDQQRLVGSLQQQLQQRKAAEAGITTLERLKQQAIAAGAPFMQVSQYDTKLADLYSMRDSLPPEAELRAQLQLEAVTLSKLQQNYSDLGTAMVGRIPAQPRPDVSVEVPGAVGSPVEKATSPKGPNEQVPAGKATPKAKAGGR